MEIKSFELPEEEMEMIEDWKDMIEGRKLFDEKKVHAIQAFITGFLSAKLEENKR